MWAVLQVANVSFGFIISCFVNKNITAAIFVIEQSRISKCVHIKNLCSFLYEILKVVYAYVKVLPEKVY